MIGFAELEVEGLTGAAYGEKNLDSLVQRNGYRDWTWETRAGTVELRIPKLRKGSGDVRKGSRDGARARPIFPKGSSENIAKAQQRLESMGIEWGVCFLQTLPK